ncbi:hypothetical protein P7C70_g9416, partial [Phenoliferia sp. Uapishka_3]
MTARRVIMPGTLEPRPLPHDPHLTYPPVVPNPRTIANRARFLSPLPPPSSNLAVALSPGPTPKSDEATGSPSIAETEVDEAEAVSAVPVGRQLKRKVYLSSPEAQPSRVFAGVSGFPQVRVSSHLSTTSPARSAPYSSSPQESLPVTGEWVRIRPKRSCEAFRKSTGPDPLFPREVWVEYDE